MTRGGEKLGLAPVGLLGVVLGGFQGLHGGAKFARSASDLLLHRVVGAFQFGLVLLEAGDIGIGRHVPAARHRVAANLDHAAVFVTALENVGSTAPHVVHSSIYGRLDLLAAAAVSSLQVEPDQFV